MTEYRYFSIVEPHVVRRYGTGVFIGCKRVSSGWEWFPDRIVRIPVEECKKFRKEYFNAIRWGALVEHDKGDFDKYQAALEQASSNNAKTSEKTRKKSKTVSDKGGK